MEWGDGDLVAAGARMGPAPPTAVVLAPVASLGGMPRCRRPPDWGRIGSDVVFRCSGDVGWVPCSSSWCLLVPLCGCWAGDGEGVLVIQWSLR